VRTRGLELPSSQMLFIAVTLASGGGAGMLQALWFEADIGIVLSLVFIANSVDAILPLPALLPRPNRPETSAAA
jgi:hypothetical protein